MKLQSVHIIIFGLLITGLLSCRSSFDPEVRTGGATVAQEGYPEFTVTSFGFFDDDDTPVLDITVNMVLGSLIYSSDEGRSSASVNITFQVYKTDRDDTDVRRLVTTEDEDYSVSMPGDHMQMSRTSAEFNSRFSVPPGDYIVITTVRDNNSRKAISSETKAVVLNPDDRTNGITHVLLRGIDKNGHESGIQSYNVPGSADSLKFNYQLVSDGSPIRIVAALKQFEADTTIPRHMSAPNYSSGSLQHRGINHNRRETLQQQTRELEQRGVVTFSYTNPALPPGNYRYQITLYEKVDGEWSQLETRARDFAFMTDNFPDIRTIQEMARPLAYLMGDREYRDFIAIQDSDSLRREFERFWLSNIGSQAKAGRVIEKYYERVENANRMFTTFKEGWKTDMGMVYILFGEPWYVDRYSNMVYWMYTYDNTERNKIFAFERTRLGSERLPFRHYVLRRQQNYHYEQYRKIQEWLDGYILERI